MRKSTYILLLILPFMLLTACGTSTSTHDEVEVNGSNEISEEAEVNEYNVPVDIESEVIALVRENVAAANNRDVDTYVSQITFEQTIAEMKDYFTTTFSTYESIGLNIEISNEEVVYYKENEAVVKVQQNTRTDEINPESNYQNDAFAIHIVHLTDEGWKIKNTIITKQAWLKEDGTLDELGEIYPATDEVEVWDNHINEMIAQDILPSKYLENLYSEEQTDDLEIQERDLDQPTDLAGIATFLIQHYANVYTVETEEEYMQIIAESFTNYDENYSTYLDAFHGDYTSVDVEVYIDESTLMEYSDFRFGGVIDVTFYLTTPDGQTETVTHFGYYEFDRPSVDDNYKIVSIQ
ncbi:hypothetical protein [Ornithinibacillus californiensis]|uniref:hypothetical protein n=1 Tax=Ornithinibacillus californiensis TaxID=161536 RepID=UPI00064DBC9F|nr:hypothetical protein [Ornithinibacillus californiensis]